jgi:hypothetical protein
MKKTLLLFGLLFSFFGYIPVVKGEDSLAQAKKEFQSIEPLQYNTRTYTKFKKQKIYDYYHAKIKSESIWEILHEKFNEWLNKLFRTTIDRKEFDTMMGIIGIIVIVIIGIILYIRKPGIFYFNRKNPLAYSIEDENIETQNLDYLTEDAVNEKRFSDAIRWQYLKTLKVLHGQDFISYDRHKTVNEYVHEIKDMNLRKQFRNLSGEFVYYRYGKGEADAGKFSRFRTAAETIQKMRTG